MGELQTGKEDLNNHVAQQSKFKEKTNESRSPRHANGDNTNLVLGVGGMFVELGEIRIKIEQLKERLELVAEAEENREIRRQIERWKLLKLRAEAELNRSEAKPGEISTRDPITLRPHPLSARLYGVIDPLEISGWQADRPARGSVIQRVDTTDLLESIDRDGILVPLVINEEGIIISGCRRWKAALQLGLTSVPVEVRSFEIGIEEKQAILDYNLHREKTFSQKMREAELLKEIVGRRAKQKMLAGRRDPRRDPTLIFGEGYSAKRHSRETDAIVGAQVRMGKDTLRKGKKIWNKAKRGDWKAAELIGALDGGTTSVNAAYTTLKKYDDSLDTPKLSRWQLEPVDSGEVWTMQQYTSELARILREIPAAGSARDWYRMIELAKELEQLARAGRAGKFSANVG